MTLDLKTLDELGLDRSFQIDILSQDRVHDDMLDRSDFEVFYGENASSQYYSQIEDAIRNKDPKRFSELLTQMRQCRDQTIAGIFRTLTTKARSELTERGILLEEGQMDLRLRDDREGFAHLQTAAAILTGNFIEAFRHEFSSPLSRERLESHIRNSLMRNVAGGGRLDILSFGIQLMHEVTGTHLVQDGMTGTSEQGNQFWGQPDHEVEQRKAAPLQYGEYHQPSYITALERRFGLDIRTSGNPPNPSESRTLARALQNIQARRPTDFSRLRTLQLFDGPDRVGGETFHPATIRMEGAFAPPMRVTQARYFPPWYSQDLIRAYGSPSAQRFIEKVVCHELGHIVEGSEGDAWYVARYGHQTGRERFAEDYSVFVLSGGKRVARYGPTGTELIPDYRQRMEYMRAHYPVSDSSRPSIKIERVGDAER